MENLTGVPETMLIPLWAKAIEEQQPEPIIHDKKAAEILNNLDYDFAKFKDSKLSQIGVVIRTEIIDQALTAFLDKHGKSNVINIGAGLDTRYTRLNDPRIAHWYDLDVPEAIKLRQRFFNETSKISFIAKSVFDFTWFEQIPDSELPLIILCEGVLMYFEEKELQTLFNKLALRFPQSEFVFDFIPTAMVKHSKHHDSVNKIKNSDGKAVKFKWGLALPQDITRLGRSITFINSWDYYDYHKKRWSWFRLLTKLPIIRKMITCGIIHIRLG